MNPNLAGCFWAEQSNRQRLDGQAARGWLAEEADTGRPPRRVAANVRRAENAGLAWLRSRLLHGLPARPARRLANQGGSAV